MLDESKISVVVPVFNSGNALFRSIESLLSQTFKNLEIIIVNDASTDNTDEVIASLKEKSNKIVSLNLAINRGVFEARLAGLRISTGSWIGFLDADDFARPDMYEILYSAAKGYDVDVVVCGSDRVNPERKFIAKKLKFPRSEKVNTEIFERFCNFEFGTGMLWNKLYRRSIIEPTLLLESPWRQNINEDLLINIGCFNRAKSVYLLSNVLHEYVLSEESVTSRINNCHAYVETYRAYALAIHWYQGLGSKSLMHIIDMYRVQLAWENYTLSSSVELSDCEDQLQEAIALLWREYPYALSAVVARRPIGSVGGRLIIKSLYTAFINRIKFLLGK